MGTWEWDVATQTITASDGFYALLGIDPSIRPLPYGAIYDCLHIDDHMRLYQAATQVLDERRSFDLECSAVLPSGVTRNLYSIGEVTVSDGAVTRVVGVTHDVTKWKLAEEALTLSREQQDALLNNIPDIAFLKGRDSRFLAVNAALAKAWGVTPSEMIGKSDFDFIPADLAERYRADDLRTLASGTQMVVQEPLMLPDGTSRWIETLKTPYRDADGAFVGIVGIARDITERNRTAEALVKQTEILQSVMDNMDEAVIVVDEHQEYLISNPAADVLLDHLIPPAGAVLDHGDGVFLSDTVTRVTPDASPLARASRGERVDDMELLVRSAQGTDKRWYVASGRPVCDRNGQLRGGVVVCRDVTQKRQLERQLLQSQKLEAIGQLAAGIAHEINNPAQYIGDNVRFLGEGFAHLLKVVDDHVSPRAPHPHAGVTGETHAGADGDTEYFRHEIPKAIQEALEGIQRIADIVGAVKGFSHPSSDQMVPVDINHQIEHTIAVCRNEWKDVARIVTDFDPSIAPILCFAGEINQVMLNILVNAAHAIIDQAAVDGAMGTITVTTRRLDTHVEITVRDTGAGIPDAVRDRIFDPFFTTKDVGRGTGQGLAIAHTVVVENHGGSITFDTEVGRGTTFVVLLPLRPATPVEVAA